MNFNVNQAPIYRVVSAEAVADNNNNSRGWGKKVVLKHSTRKANNICTERHNDSQWVPPLSRHRGYRAAVLAT